MIIDAVGAAPLADGRVARTARLRLAGGRDWPIEVIVPAELAPAEPDDATCALPLALLLAMRLGEPLEIQARVDASLLSRVYDIQAYFRAANERLHGIEVVVAGTLPSPQAAPAPRAVCCMSRGVDSLYQAAQRRSAGGPLDALVFVDRLEPVHDDAVRVGELAAAHEVAALIGLPLIEVIAPLRELPDTLFDWEDAVGAGLAWVAHSLCGGVGRFVIPSSESVGSLSPSGSGPAIDPLFSSERVRIEHGDVAETRMGKVAWLAARRPDLLPLLKVCYAESTVGNCGRCGKCRHTMACLRAAGALDGATGFPDEVDLEALADERFSLVSIMLEYAAVRDAAEDAGDGALVGAIERALRHSATTPRLSGLGAWSSLRARHSDALRTLLRDGVRDPDATDAGRFGRKSPALGLVRALDLRGRRHVHGAGWRPAAVITAELGGLMPRTTESATALWVLADGRLATADHTPAGARPGAAARLRHAAAPLLRAGDPRRAARRALDLAAVRTLGPAAPAPGAVPAGYLYSAAGEDRVALWVGDHGVTGDQYSAHSAAEIIAAGYEHPRLLGYLEREAPLTGQLGDHGAPIIPWA